MLGFGLETSLRQQARLIASVEVLAFDDEAVDAYLDERTAANPALDRGSRTSWSTPSFGTDDRFARLPAGEHPADRLLADARLELAASDVPIAEAIVGSLDEHGRLGVGADELARLSGATVADVERVADVIRAVGPAGVGARDARECLLLQLDRIAEEEALPPYVRTIVEDQLAQLAAGDDRSIAGTVGCSAEDVAHVRGFIRRRLRPWPSWSSGSPIRVRRPALAFRVTGAGIAIDDLEGDRCRVDVLAGGWWETSGLARDARDVARLLARRRRTTHAVAASIARHQEAFLRRTASRPAALTRARVAAELGLHESTVSRAVADRCVELPWRQVIPLADLLPRPTEIRELVLRELAAHRGVSDRVIAERLAGSGVVVARRTVAKYRAAAAQAAPTAG